MDWLRDIELDEYADKLQGTGLNGPVIVCHAIITYSSYQAASDGVP